MGLIHKTILRAKQEITFFSNGEGRSLPAPPAKPDGASPLSWGFLAPISSGLGGCPNPIIGESSRELRP